MSVFDSGLCMIIGFKTKVGGRRRQCYLFKYNAGGCRIVCKRGFFDRNEPTELYRTEDDEQVHAAINELLYSTIEATFFRPAKYQVNEIWESERNN